MAQSNRDLLAHDPRYAPDAMRSRLRTLALIGLASEIAREYGLTTYTLCTAYAACEARHASLTLQQVADLHGAASTNTSPKREIAVVRQWLAGDISGHTSNVIAKARAILTGVTLRAVTGIDALKTVSYSAALAGDLDSIVVDRWIHRAATGDMSLGVPNGDLYRAIAEALADVAQSFGWRNANMQALIWYVINPKPDMHTPKPCADCASQ